MVGVRCAVRARAEGVGRGEVARVAVRRRDGVDVGRVGERERRGEHRLRRARRRISGLRNVGRGGARAALGKSELAKTWLGVEWWYMRGGEELLDGVDAQRAQLRRRRRASVGHSCGSGSARARRDADAAARRRRRSPPRRRRRSRRCTRRWCRTAGRRAARRCTSSATPPPPTERRPERGRRGRAPRSRRRRRALPSADLVVASPLPRALRTAELAFAAQIADGAAFVAHDAAREVVDAPPTRGRRRRRSPRGCGGGRGRPGGGGRAVGRRRPAHRAAAAAAERGTNPGGGESGDVASVSVGTVVGCGARGSNGLHTPCAGARPLRRAVALDARAARGGDRLGVARVAAVPHAQLRVRLAHSARQRRPLCRVALGVVARAGWACWLADVGLESQHSHRRWLSDPSAPIPARSAGARSSHPTTLAG